MTTHIAIIANDPAVVPGAVCDLSLVTAEVTGSRQGEYLADEDQYDEIPEYGPTDDVVFTVALAVPVDDEHRDAKACDEADQVLRARGWCRTGGWEFAQDAIYAEVESAE